MGINNSLHGATNKIIPEELVPVAAIGKMVPNRNPDNCFAQAQERATLTPTMVCELKEDSGCGCSRSRCEPHNLCLGLDLLVQK
ncbi:MULTISPECIES: catalase [unclassified Microcoleus]|uniref:catalase n=1 Tax=unclassified Microcoleus TaxID=2642155 RepID=UPI00403F7FC5